MDSVPINLAYAAGVIDSDGYIGVNRSTYAMRVRGDATQAIYQPRIMVKQVVPAAIELLHEMFNGYVSKAPPTAELGRFLFTWEVHSAKAGSACEALLPYLRIKRAQAENALEVARINGASRPRFDLPDVIDGEPMVTMAEAARRLGKSYEVVIQSIRKGNVPHVRIGPRKVLIPESYLEIWASRGNRPRRHADRTAQLERCYLRAKELNRVGT